MPTGDHRADRHIPDERLAELADGEGETALESAHLASCADCLSVLEDIRGVIVAAADMRNTLAPPLSSWGRLQPALLADGLIERGDSFRRPYAPGGVRRGRLMRVAAGLLLAVGGAAAGRVSAGASALPALAGGDSVGAQSVAINMVDSTPTPASPEQAMRILARAERDYRLATSYLASDGAAAVGADRPELYQRRLAVMDEVASLTRAALAENPHDAVLSQYYLASLGVREATLQSLASALPAGAQLSRF